MGLLDDTGKPLQLHPSRIRTTYLNTLSRKGWTGNTAIDPNHSAAVEGDRYLTAQTPAQMDAVEAIIEESQADILRRALPQRFSPRKRPPARPPTSPRRRPGSASLTVPCPNY